MNSGKHGYLGVYQHQFSSFNEARAMNSGKHFLCLGARMSLFGRFNEARAMNSGKLQICATFHRVRIASMRPEQ